MMSRHNGLVNGHNGRSSQPHNGLTVLSTNGQNEEHLLTAEQIEAIWQQRAAELATPPPVEPAGETFDLLVFCLSGKRYGIKVTHVREIYPSKQITPVPRTPDFVVGIFSARGRLLSVIDLHAFLGLPKTTLSSTSKIIVVTSEERAASNSSQIELGFLADEVEDVSTIFENDLTPAVSGLIDSQVEFTMGVTPDMLVVLNLQTFLKNKRLIVHDEI